jgi:outer membrane receptor protein involved in Fe transport
MRRLITSVGLAILVGLVLVRGAKAQEIATASHERGPRFLLAMATKVVPIDVSKTAVLARRLDLELEGATLKQALAAIEAQSGLVLAYSDDAVPLDKRVHLRAEAITTAAALTDVLLDAGVDVVFKADGSAALVRRPPPAQNGSISGRVTDAKTSAAIPGATVVIDGTSLSATSDNDGRYRLTEVHAGTYSVRARYIGYAPRAVSVTVSADQEATADFALEKSVQRLDEVVTTGTVVPTEVKALPTPVTVISDTFIAQQRPHTFQELFRQAIPTAVSWDLAGSPQVTGFSVRGASTLNTETGQMKVFVDGVEAADLSFAGVDPASIARVEVIRGPQAAAIYGSDAIGGVIQIFTKRADPNLVRPQVDVEAALGMVQTPYAGYGGVLRQTYTAAVRGGGSDVSYNFGGGYSHTGDYLPTGEISRQSIPSAYGGMHYARGIITADVSGRYYVNDAPSVLPPAVLQTGIASLSKPFYWLYQFQKQTMGSRITVAPTSWWRHTVTVGFDRQTFDRTQTQPRLTTPADTFLFVQNGSETKTSIAYNTSAQGTLGAGLTGSLTAGFDHYSLPTTFWNTSGALNTTGTIQTDSSQPVSATRTITNNTGYFAQVQLGFHDVLFLTGGLRAEQNTNFGDSLNTPLSPRAGLSYVQPIGAATLKLRGSWGRAIRAPDPGFKTAFVSAGQVVLANALLAPERQHGWDAGMDAVFGSHGSVSVTYYNQTADNLIDLEQLAAEPVVTYQYQNVGRVKNTGVEIEAGMSIGPLQLKSQYGYTRARVEQLALHYTGDLLVGDQTLAIPKHTAGASLSLTPHAGTTVSTGLTYVGSWNEYDSIGEFRCLGGTGPCPPGFLSTFAFRDFITAYPGFVKVNASLSQQLTRVMSAFVSIDNLTNNQTHEFSNSDVVMGRISTVGFRLRY